MIAATPAEPCYAVIFTSRRSQPDEGYDAMAQAMEKLAAQQPGYLGAESARSEIGITVSYWDSLESIRAWKENAAHQVAQHSGRQKWYAEYQVRICLVERAYRFDGA